MPLDAEFWDSLRDTEENRKARTDYEALQKELEENFCRNMEELGLIIPVIQRGNQQ